MAAETQATTRALQSDAGTWAQARRVGFRFCFVYFALFCLSNQVFSSVFPVPKTEQPDLATLWPIRLGVIWVAEHILRVKTQIVYADSASGDRWFDWTLDLCLVLIALVACAVWSLAHRKRPDHPNLYELSLLCLRIALASQMFSYGFAKAVPLQMYYPFPFKLLESLRNFSPMGVLWTSIGISPGYEIFTGFAELTAGFLLIFPRTATLGALVCLADAIQVFVLNMTYDVCVKLFSFHLIVMSLFLLSPQLGPLFNFFFRGQPAALASPQPVFRSSRANRIAAGLLAGLWIWMIGNVLYADWDGWHKVGPGQPKSALAGIWTIDQIVVDGQRQPLTTTSAGEWRRMTFDLPDWVHIQCMDDSLTGYGAALDAKGKTLALTSFRDKNWHANFSFDRPAFNELILDGAVNGHQEHLQLELMDAAQLPLTTRGFHWVQDYPFNH